VDSFLGSGTAVIAAQRTGRICYGMERDARYCDVILARWEALTGQEAGCLPSASPPYAGVASRKAAPSSTKPTPVRGRK